MSLHHQGPIAGVAAQGPWIATAGYDNQVILREWASGRALARGCHDHLVNHCAFSPCGRWLVSAGSDQVARVWALPAMKLVGVLPEHDDDVDMAVFSPDGRFIATCALDRRVRVFDRTGRCLQVLAGHTGNVLSLAWSLDGRQLVSSSVDGSLRTWDAHAGTLLRVSALDVRTDSVEFDAQGRLWAGDDAGRIVCVDTDGRIHATQAHRAGIKKIALAESPGRLITLSYDRSLAVWDREGGVSVRERSRTTLPAEVWARAACVLPDGRIATGSFGGRHATYDPATACWDLQGVQAGLAVNALMDEAGGVVSVGDAGDVRQAGRVLARMGSLCNVLVQDEPAGTWYTGGQLGRLFDARTGQVLHQHRSPLNCAVVWGEPGERRLAVGTYTGEILVFALAPPGGAGPAQPPQLLACIDAHANAVKGLAVGQGQLFSVCANTDVAWHDARHLGLTRHLARAHERIANAACALGQGRFATVSRDGALRVFGPEGVQRWPGPHANSIKCLAASPCGRWLMTGSYGGTLAAFDLHAQAWQPLQRPTAAGLSSIVWCRAADGRPAGFVAASYDGQIYPAGILASAVGETGRAAAEVQDVPELPELAERNEQPQLRELAQLAERHEVHS